MRIVILCLLFLQVSFAMDASIQEALKCVEKKRMDVFFIEKIKGKVYAKVSSIHAEEDPCCDCIVDRGGSIFEIKKNCFFEKKDWFQKIEYVARKGLLVVAQNAKEDSIIVMEKNSVLWSCPLKIRGSRTIQFLDKNRLMVSIDDGGNGNGDSIGLLDSKCQWTLFERNARLPFVYSTTSSSRFLYYEINHKPYIMFYDSLYNKHWGTSSSFYIDVSTQNIACGHDDDYDDLNMMLIKCIKWTGGTFVEKTLSHKISVEGACHVAERLFPCGDDVCAQNYETKKIEILVDE